MGTRRGIEAVVGKNKALNWFATDDVGRNNFLDIVVGDVAIPDLVGINDHSRAVLALVEASGLISANVIADTVLAENLLEVLVERTFGVGVATSPGMVFVALVGADKDVLFKLRHGSRLQQRGHHSMARTCDE